MLAMPLFVATGGFFLNSTKNEWDADIATIFFTGVA
jgi:hypothetical protein